MEYDFCLTDLGNKVFYAAWLGGPTPDDLARPYFLHECSKEWLAEHGLVAVGHELKTELQISLEPIVNNKGTLIV